MIPWHFAVHGALLSLALSLPAGALAARDRSAERLGEVRVTVESITGSIEALERQVAPGRGFITEADAVRRFEDYVYLHLIGEHAAAAEGFFTLVTLAALGDAGLHRDAEWYLAESLFEMGNTSTAEARYRVIADDAAHPFREDAVRRLLELYAITGQSDRFDALYRLEIVEGRVQPSELITYSLARSFIRRGELDKALEHFERLDPSGAFGPRGRYHQGTIEVMRGDLDAALEHFRVASEVPVDSDETRRLYDLSLLAIARIHFERAALVQAAEAYERVGGDSHYLADKLYEVIWTFIKQERYGAALDGVELFLLRFPDHPQTAHLKLLDAHLRLEQKEFAEALVAYERVIADYTPVEARFGELARSETEPRTWFHKVLAGARGEPGATTGLPGYAVAMLVDHPDMARSLGLFREVARQEGQIEGAETLIGELRQVMDTAAGIGGYERLRYEVSVEQGRATELQLELLGLEEAWLAEVLPVDRQAELAGLAGMRRELVRLVERLPDDLGTEDAIFARREHLAALEALELRVGTLRAQAVALRLEADALPADDAQEGDDAEGDEDDEADPLAVVERALEAALAELEAVRAAGPSTAWSDRISEQEEVIAVTIEELRRGYLSQRPTPESDDLTQRIDRLQTTLQADQQRLAGLRDRLVTAESSELSRIRARFAHEVREVGAQRVGLAETLERAEDVSAAITRSGFGRMEAFFAESVLRADMGVVDVYWSQKIDVADQRERTISEKAQLLADLEARFGVIREKLGP